MDPSRPDLLALSRERGAPNIDSRAGTLSVVPRPPRRWATRLLLPLAIVLGTLGVLGYAARDALRSTVEVWVVSLVPKVPTETDRPREADAPQGEGVLVQAPGWIEPAPFATIVPALADGVIERVLALEGERIEAGQIVATMIDRDAILSLRAAESALEQRRADAEVARAELATAEARIEVDRAVVEELEDDVARKRDLVGVGGVSIGEFRRLEIRLGGARAAVAASERKAQESRVMVMQRETAVTAAAVVVEEAQLRVERMRIAAPVGGVVLSRNVEPGSRISMSANGAAGGEGAMSGVVMRLYDPAKLQVRVDVPLADAARVGVGSAAVISTEAIPDTVFRGVVSRVVHEADIQRNTVQFKVDIEAPSPVLKPEMLTRVRFVAARAPGAGSDGESVPALLVPMDAVHDRSGGKAWVWVAEVAEDGAMARRREIGVVDHSAAHLAASGLRPTDRVIVEAASPLREGQRVKILGERVPVDGAASDEGGAE